MLAACQQPWSASITQIEVERDDQGFGAGRTVALPLHRFVPADSDAVYWYRLPTADYTHLSKPAIFVGRAATNFQIFLDNEWVFGGGFDRSPMQYTWNTPFLVPLSQQTLARSEFIRIAIYALAGNRVVLEPLHIAEYETLIDLHHSSGWLQHKLSYSITLIAAGLAAISLMLWVASPRQAQYLYGFLCAIALICANFNYFVLQPLLEQYWWQALAHASLDWFCVFALLWVTSVRGMQNTFTRYVWLWGVLSTAANLFLPIVYRMHVVETLHIVSIAIFLLVLWRARGTDNTDPVEHRLLILVSLTANLMCLFDLLVQFALIQVPNVPRLMPMVVFVIVLFYHVILLRRFLQTYRNAHRTSAELAGLVRQKERELGKQYQQLACLQAEHARDTERAHIFREIHDGMGGHLMSAMALSKQQSANKAMLTALQSAHDDMRLLIDGGGSLQQADLAEILGQLRPRLQPQLQATGVQLVWQVDAESPMPVLDVQQRMHVVRIIQECITNVIKHANADQVVVSCEADTDGCVTIAIADNGCARQAVVPSGGNGLRNMQYRAAQLGGKITFATQTDGTTVRLRLPHLRRLSDTQLSSAESS